MQSFKKRAEVFEFLQLKSILNVFYFYKKHTAKLRQRNNGVTNVMFSYISPNVVLLQYFMETLMLVVIKKNLNGENRVYMEHNGI